MDPFLDANHHNCSVQVIRTDSPVLKYLQSYHKNQNSSVYLHIDIIKTLQFDSDICKSGQGCSNH